MKRLIRLLILLYPPAWRDRYGRELATLIEDTGANWTLIPDLILEATKMRLTTINWRFTGALALTGLVIATVIAFRVPDRYQSTATVSIQAGPGDDPEAVRDLAALMAFDANTRVALADAIIKPELDLYKDERQRVPLENVIQDMRRNDLKLDSDGQGNIHIAYSGRSPDEARRTVQHFVTRFIDQGYRRALQLSAIVAAQPIDPAVVAKLALHGTMRYAKPASLPTASLPAWRPVIVASGALVGILAALCLAVIRRNPRPWLYGGISVGLITMSLYFLGTTAQFPVLRYQSDATLTFNSAETLRAIMADQAWIIRQPDDPASIRLEYLPGGVKNGLLIRATHPNRFRAQRAAQIVITNMFDRLEEKGIGLNRFAWQLNGPWGQVHDPPGLPVFALGAAWIGGVINASLAVAAAAGIVLFIDRRRTLKPSSQPA